jgi:hypothetical protein
VRATLYVDESGTFGDMAGDPHSDLRVIAGLLLPSDGRKVHEMLGRVADAAGQSLPLHASEMSPTQRSTALKTLESLLPPEARVLAILDRGSGGQEHYGEVLATFVRSGFAQLQRALGPSTIGWISAQRKRTFSRPELARHIQATCAALSLGGPVLAPGRVDVIVAERSHGLQLADLVANQLRNGLRRGELRTVVPSDRLHVVSSAGSASIEALYAAVETPLPSLLDAADAALRLSRHRSEQEPWASASREEEAVGRQLLSLIVRATAGRGTSAGVATRLLHETRWRLAAKVGDYEAAALAFELWAADASAAGLAYDPDLLFSLYAAQAEVANHRGEVRLDWIEAAWRQLEATRNLETLARRFHLSNLEMVCLQNQLLVDPNAADALSEAGERASASLASYETVVDAIAGRGTGGEARRADPVLAAAGRQPAGRIDHVHGALLGTLGRTMGFVGRPQEAVALLLDARERFGTELDLERNGLSLAHAALQVLIDGGDTESAWELVVAVLERHLPDRRPDAFREVGAHRFRLRLLLKATEVGWPRDIEGFDRGAWLQTLHPDGALYAAALAAEGHPIELVGRHAALWLGKVKAPGKVTDAWWTIATRPWASGDLPAVRALKEHSARLRDGVSPVGPRGAATNPVFEYR